MKFKKNRHKKLNFKKLYVEMSIKHLKYAQSRNDSMDISICFTEAADN